ncbi:MAG: MBL fold metallo-hydrolase [Gemmatimonadaceae bacterium]|jgi:glyoxylase-like metal-dependent hydrolase (beta-lactamase superfamily II)|nr:MBL fold metallo-hydrolase [Gemmatimonadaceae bacterium]
MVRHDDLGGVVRAEFSTPRTRMIGYSVSCYLVDGLVVDAAAPVVRRDFSAWIRATRPAGVLVTHRHEDHAGNVNWLAKHGVPVGMAAATRAALAAPGPVGLYRRLVWHEMRPLTREPAPFAPAHAMLVATPGHSSDHHAVWLPDRQWLFGGDLFLGVKVRVAHPGEDPAALLRSLRAAIALRPVRLFDAHRGEVRDPIGALTAKVDWLEATIARIRDLHARGWPQPKIRDAVLGREELAGYFSRGDYSRGNLVRSVLRDVAD